MKVIFGILKVLGWTVATLLLALVTLLTAIWVKPEILFNERRVRQALHYAPKGTELTWKTFSWKFEREGSLAKKSDLDLTGICFKMGETIAGCAPEFRLDVSFSLSGLHPRVTRIGNFIADVTWLRFHPAPAEKKPPGKDPLPDLRPPSFASFYPAEMDLAKLGELRLSVRKLTVEAAKGPSLEANFFLEKEDSEPGTAKLAVHGAAEQGQGLLLKLAGEGEILPKQAKVVWNGSLDGTASGWKVHLPLDLAWSDHVDLKARPRVTKKKSQFKTPLTIAWSTSRLSLELGNMEFDQLWPKKRVLVDACHLESKLNASKGYPGKNELHCDLALVALKQGALLPPMRAKLSSTLNLRPLDARNVAADFVLAELGKNDYLESKIDLSANAKIEMTKSELVGEPELKFTSQFRVPTLQNWKRALDHTPFAVPAPFRTLAGPITLDLHLDKAAKDAVTVLAELKSDLHGPSETFVTAHRARIKLTNPWKGKKSLNVDVNAELSDVVLEAPPLRLEEPPQIIPDKRFLPSRISGPTTITQASIPLDWQVHLTTKNPLRIRTNLLKSEVPVALDLTFANEADMAGTVNIEPMPIALFKKKADIQHVTLTFHDGSKVGELNGLLVHTNPEITIKILLLGSTEKPRVDFISDPPLNRQQIVSVLLFNKSVTQLTEEEASSAGSLSQATADGALGLFSLLFLSNTPIESISYDPVSQTYAARLRLDNKTTFSVGSDFDRERQVALRRRLGGRWAIRTELHNQEGKPDVLLTLLEWFKRF